MSSATPVRLSQQRPKAIPDHQVRAFAAAHKNERVAYATWREDVGEEWLSGFIEVAETTEGEPPAYQVLRCKEHDLRGVVKAPRGRKRFDFPHDEVIYLSLMSENEFRALMQEEEQDAEAEKASAEAAILATEKKIADDEAREAKVRETRRKAVEQQIREDELLARRAEEQERRLRDAEAQRVRDTIDAQRDAQRGSGHPVVNDGRTEATLAAIAEQDTQQAKMLVVKMRRLAMNDAHPLEVPISITVSTNGHYYPHLWLERIYEGESWTTAHEQFSARWVATFSHIDVRAHTREVIEDHKMQFGNWLEFASQLATGTPLDRVPIPFLKLGFYHCEQLIGLHILCTRGRDYQQGFIDAVADAWEKRRISYSTMISGLKPRKADTPQTAPAQRQAAGNARGTRPPGPRVSPYQPPYTPGTQVYAQQHAPQSYYQPPNVYATTPQQGYPSRGGGQQHPFRGGQQQHQGGRRY